MELLANGCRYSGIKVTPKNWKDTNSTRKNWTVYYRFYDDNHRVTFPKGKLCTDRSMNFIKDAEKRRAYARQIIDMIKDDLEQRDYNPITGYCRQVNAPKITYGINPNTPLDEALQLAHDKLEIAKKTKDLNKSVLKYALLAIADIHCDVIPVKEIRRLHVLAILDQCGKLKNELEKKRHSAALKDPFAKAWQKKLKIVWSANTYNFYRSHLQMMFKVLCTWQTIESNPVDEYLPIKKSIKRKRKTLTPQQRTAIDRDLRQTDYRFWLFMHIFFHSGARETEMMLVKKEHVHIEEQYVTYTILKGTEYREEDRPIKDIAINLWQQALVGANHGQYLFGKGLEPRDRAIRAEQITRRWRKWVKNRTDEEGKKVYGEELADFYSLKHTHSTEMAAKVGTRLAALHNRHTEAVLKSNYDVHGEARDIEIMKGLGVSFVPEVRTGNQV